MRKVIKNYILVVVLQILLQIVFVLPLAILIGNRIESGSLFEIVINFIFFSLSLFVTLKILKLKKEASEYKLFPTRLAAVYLAGAILSFLLSGFSFTQLGYPIFAFLVSDKYLKANNNKEQI